MKPHNCTTCSKTNCSIHAGVSNMGDGACEHWTQKHLSPLEANRQQYTIADSGDTKPLIDVRHTRVISSDEFNQIVDKQLAHCKAILIHKAREYATEDRAHNFKQAAKLQGNSDRQALGGMMSKHIISVYDMLKTDEQYPDELWDEKIADSINYLLLLKAVIASEKEPTP